MGPCAPWVTEEELPEGKPALPDGGPSWGEVVTFASDVLFDLSGQRWTGDCGEVTAVLESCGACACSAGGSYSPWTPVLLEGSWYNCRCASPALLRLPDSAVREVTAVTVRGVVRDPGTYRLVRGGSLADLTGVGWQTCPGGVGITYVTGYPPPAGGRMAARALAVELGKALVGDSSCKLPQRVTSVQRQGVTIGVLDRWPDLDKGRTGLYTVDLWLASVTRPVRGAAVWSPDLPVAHRT